MAGICQKGDKIDIKRVIYHSKIVTKLGSTFPQTRDIPGPTEENKR